MLAMSIMFYTIASNLPPDSLLTTTGVVDVTGFKSNSVVVSIVISVSTSVVVSVIASIAVAEAYIVEG